MDKIQTSLDFSYLEELLTLTKGQSQMVRDCVQRFIHNAEHEIGELKSFQQTHDRATLKAQAHHLISTCCVVGASRMIALCRSLSKQALTSEIASLYQDLNALDKDFHTVKELLTDYVKNLPK